MKKSEVLLSDATAITLHVRYFALLRELRGLDSETLTTPARVARDLYAELQDRHGFRFPVAALRIAINDEFSDWDAPLRAGDSVAFIPPVAGG